VESDPPYIYPASALMFCRNIFTKLFYVHLYYTVGEALGYLGKRKTSRLSSVLKMGAGEVGH
jgi:hypothetical protein